MIKRSCNQCFYDYVSKGDFLNDEILGIIFGIMLFEAAVCYHIFHINLKIIDMSMLRLQLVFAAIKWPKSLLFSGLNIFFLFPLVLFIHPDCFAVSWQVLEIGCPPSLEYTTLFRPVSHRNLYKHNRYKHY